MTKWQFTEADQAFIEREVEPFLPDRIFDAHAHLFRQEHYAPGKPPAQLEGNPEVIGLDTYWQDVAWLHPNRTLTGGLFFGLAFNGDRAANNRFVAEEVARGRQAGHATLGQMVIAPDDDPEQIRDEVRRSGFVGLKVYHTMAKVDGPTWHAPIEAYMPEAHVQIAHEEGLSITLHMVRNRALADPVNQETIRRYCETYPNMRLILAHAGRGFNPWHTIEGIGSLRGLENVWFDTSAVTEAGAFEAIIETMGYERLMYGTDYYVSHMRGRCIALGDSFHWIYAEDMNLDERHTTLQPVLIGLESLRSIRLAAQRLKMTDTQIEDLFYGNAARLYNLQ